MKHATLLLFAFLFCAHLTAEDTRPDSRKKSSPYYRIHTSEDDASREKKWAALNLSTPQACMENFVFSCRDKNYERASYSLDMRYVENQSRKKRKEYSRKLFYVLRQKMTIPWHSIPDTPDAAVIESRFKSVSGDQRNLLLGRISDKDRDIEIRLHRVRYGEKKPVWLYSANLVENIPLLYENFGPGLLDQYLPAWIKIRFWGICRFGNG